MKVLHIQFEVTTQIKDDDDVDEIAQNIVDEVINSSNPIIDYVDEYVEEVE